MSNIVCVIVAGMAGIYCEHGAEQIGNDCRPRMNEVYDCYITESELMFVGSWYDPALCRFGYTINCDENPTVTADGSLVADCYGYCMACPAGWLGRQFEFADGVGNWQCRDRGGDIKPTYGERYVGYYWEGWYVPLDFMWPYERGDPHWAYLFVSY